MEVLEATKFTSMSASIDSVLMAMKLHDVEQPYNLPDDPEFCSREENSRSLIGRVLNPDKQSISDLILDLPRKWQLYDKVRGIALSSEWFQFIFKCKDDLEDILNRGGPNLQSMVDCHRQVD